MKSATQRVGVALVGGAMLLALGCQQSNESLIDEQARKTAGAEVKDMPPPPKSQAEFGQRSQQSNPFAKGSGSGYPGTGGGARR